MWRTYGRGFNSRPRNETLDCKKYALAALRLSGIDLKARAKKRNETTEAPNKPPVKKQPIATAFQKTNIGW